VTVFTPLAHSLSTRLSHVLCRGGVSRLETVGNIKVCVMQLVAIKVLIDLEKLCLLDTTLVARATLPLSATQ
jgi:hypothetical protein